MRSNIKGWWQPGHQCESFYWSIIYTVVLSNAETSEAILQRTRIWPQTQTAFNLTARFLRTYFSLIITVRMSHLFQKLSRLLP